MKFCITGDNHVDFLRGRASVILGGFTKALEDVNPRFVLNLGDMTNGWMEANYASLETIMNDPCMFYVLGNHDLWSPHERARIAPDKSFNAVISRLKNKKYKAASLEQSFLDKDTIWLSNNDECVLVGTMGFPDFTHPVFIMPKEYYNKSHCTNDGSFIDLTMGWLMYTDKIMASFSARLDKAVATAANEVIVATHYPIFEGQYRLSGDEISAYFFCYTAGELVRKAAKQHPEKRFWCFAAHAHDYCRGILETESDNIVSYGLQADYGRMTFATFDTELDFSQDVKVTWFEKPPTWVNHCSIPKEKS